MHFLPFVSTILATAVLIASEPSAQTDSFEIAASDVGTLPDDISYDLIPCSYQPLGLIVWQENSLHHHRQETWTKWKLHPEQ